MLLQLKLELERYRKEARLVQQTEEEMVEIPRGRRQLLHPAREIAHRKEKVHTDAQESRKRGCLAGTAEQ